MKDTKRPADKDAMTDDPVHGLEDWDEDPREVARRQIAFLAEGLDTEAKGSAAGAVLDEAYRAAHLLRSSLDPSTAPNILRVARQMQALVTAARQGVVPVGPAVFSLVGTAANAVRDSLEAVLKGRREGAAAQGASQALEAFLGTALAAPMDAAETPGPPRYTRISAAKLEEALAAASRLSTTVAAFSRSRDSAAQEGATLRDLSVQRRALAAEIVTALPEALAAAARGEAAAKVAEDLAAKVSSLAALEAEGEEALSRLSSRAEEAADAGMHAVESVREVLAGLPTVSLRHVLHGLDDAARGAHRRLKGLLDVSTVLGDGEIDAANGPVLRRAALLTVRGLAGPARGKKRSGAGAPDLVLTVESFTEDGTAGARIAGKGNLPATDELRKVLAPAVERLQNHKGSLRLERRRSDRISVTIALPAPVLPGGADARFLVVRADGSLYAIPSRDVVECVALPWSEGQGMKSVTLGDAKGVRAGVVTQAGKERIILLVDSLLGEESLHVQPHANVGVRADRTVVSVLEPPGIAALAYGPASRH